jgi:hypothetical protein
MIALRSFIGVVGGVEKSFARGDAITKSEADEMNLSAKPHLVKKEDTRGPKTSKA